MVTEYKTSVHFHHSPYPWDNELMMKRKPTYYHGWFTIDELRQMNKAFANKDSDWIPNLDSGRAVEVSLYHPHNNYYVLIHEARERDV